VLIIMFAKKLPIDFGQRKHFLVYQVLLDFNELQTNVDTKVKGCTDWHLVEGFSRTIEFLFKILQIYYYIQIFLFKIHTNTIMNSLFFLINFFESQQKELLLFKSSFDFLHYHLKLLYTLSLCASNFPNLFSSASYLYTSFYIVVYVRNPKEFYVQTSKKFEILTISQMY